jgi:ppGpp synthetase/RelA/SpoT-type nucleotidyltranferase
MSIEKINVLPVRWSESSINSVMFSLLIDTKSHLDLQALYSKNFLKNQIYEILENSKYISQQEFDNHISNTNHSVKTLNSSPEHNLIKNQCSSFSNILKSSRPELYTITNQPTLEQLAQLQNHLGLLEKTVKPKLLTIIKSFLKSVNFGYEPQLSVRVKSIKCIYNKLDRMRNDKTGRGSPEYTLADMYDVIGFRIIVNSIADFVELSELIDYNLRPILIEKNNKFLSSQRINPYRVISYTLVIFNIPVELQLSFLEASIISDIDHNAIFKPSIPLSSETKEELQGIRRYFAIKQDIEYLKIINTYGNISNII